MDSMTQTPGRRQENDPQHVPPVRPHPQDCPQCRDIIAAWAADDVDRFPMGGAAS